MQWGNGSHLISRIQSNMPAYGSDSLEYKLFIQKLIMGIIEFLVKKENSMHKIEKSTEKAPLTQH